MASTPHNQSYSPERPTNISPITIVDSDDEMSNTDHPHVGAAHDANLTDTTNPTAKATGKQLTDAQRAEAETDKNIRAASETQITKYVQDILTCGMHFLSEMRTRDDITMDPAFRKMLQDPLPNVKKPFALINPVANPAPVKVPRALINYFENLTFHTNKIFASLYIWLDLFTAHKIYIPFTTLCEIQGHLFTTAQAKFNWHPGIPFQTPATQHWTLGVMASARLLHVWSKTVDGKKYLKEMEVTIEKKRTSDEKTADRMLHRMGFQEWESVLGDDFGQWLAILHQRWQ